MIQEPYLQGYFHLNGGGHKKWEAHNLFFLIEAQKKLRGLGGYKFTKNRTIEIILTCSLLTPQLSANSGQFLRGVAI